MRNKSLIFLALMVLGVVVGCNKEANTTKEMTSTKEVTSTETQPGGGNTVSTDVHTDTHEVSKPTTSK